MGKYIAIPAYMVLLALATPSELRAEPAAGANAVDIEASEIHIMARPPVITPEDPDEVDEFELDKDASTELIENKKRLVLLRQKLKDSRTRLEALIRHGDFDNPDMNKVKQVRQELELYTKELKAITRIQEEFRAARVRSRDLRHKGLQDGDLKAVAEEISRTSKPALTGVPTVGSEIPENTSRELPPATPAH